MYPSGSEKFTIQPDTAGEISLGEGEERRRE
jgi:hypothetical protein